LAARRTDRCATSLKEPALSSGSWCIFSCTPSAEAIKGFVGPRVGLSSRAQESGIRVVTVFVFEVVEPFFSGRLHPNTSLREYACRLRQSFGPREGTRHRVFSATVSHCKAVSISLTLHSRVESKWHIRLACRRGLLPQGERADATAILLVTLTLVRTVLPSDSGTEERVGGAGGGASSPCSPARCRRKSRMDAWGKVPTSAYLRRVVSSV
jgi:hypothetical protein